MKRRAFVSVTAAALVAGPLAPQHVDPALITYFQEQLEGHYRADMFLGPHDLIGTVSAQYQLIDKLVRSAKGETRRGLLRVGAAYAALVGWLYQDAGDMDGAHFWRGGRPATAGSVSARRLSPCGTRFSTSSRSRRVGIAACISPGTPLLRPEQVSRRRRWRLPARSRTSRPRPVRRVCGGSW